MVVMLVMVVLTVVVVAMEMGMLEMGAGMGVPVKTVVHQEAGMSSRNLRCIGMLTLERPGWTRLLAGKRQMVATLAHGHHLLLLTDLCWARMMMREPIVNLAVAGCTKECIWSLQTRTNHSLIMALHYHATFDMPQFELEYLRPSCDGRYVQVSTVIRHTHLPVQIYP